ncbi:MAG TPA: hypothetical protein VIG04_08450 [Gemmatimonadales bacterium]
MSARIELMLRHAISGGGSASRGDDDGSGRTARMRVLFAVRTDSFRAYGPGNAGHRVGGGKIGGTAVRRYGGKDGKEGKDGPEELSS